MNLNTFFALVAEATTAEELVQLFLCEGARHLNTDIAVFFKFVETKRTLVAVESLGIDRKILDGIGLDLQAVEPGFYSEQLLEPRQLKSLQEFAAHGLNCEDALAWPLADQQRPRGVFLFGIRQAKSRSGRESTIEEEFQMSQANRFLNQRLRILSLEEQVRRMSVYDTQSEALNVTSFRKKLEEEISRARRIRKPVSVVLVAIDRFHDLTLEVPNETLQQFMKIVRGTLQKASRINDFVGRFAPDMFAICLPHTSQSGALLVAERIQRIFAKANLQPLFGRAADIVVTLAVSEYPNCSYDAEHIMRTAERALFETKRQGASQIGVAIAPDSFVPDFLVRDAEDISPAAR